MTLETIFVVSFLIFIFFSTIYFKKLNILGAFLALIIGVEIYLIKGITILTPILVFFILSTLIDSIKTKKHEARGIRNIFGNLGTAIILLLTETFLGISLIIPIYASIAAAFSDTSSSELGMMSKEKPIDIITRKKVRKGANAGVTLFGTLCGLIAAVIIAFIYWIFMQKTIETIVVAISGFAGTIFDSLLGKLENKKILTNDSVNFIATFLSAILSLILLTIIRLSF